MPAVVVLPVPFTPTTKITAGRPSTFDTMSRSNVGSTSVRSSSRSSILMCSGVATPSTLTLVRSRAINSWVGPTPRSAVSKVSSTWSQVESVSSPELRRASRPFPIALLERAKRARSRYKRPAAASGISTSRIADKSASVRSDARPSSGA